MTFVLYFISNWNHNVSVIVSFLCHIIHFYNVKRSVKWYVLSIYFRRIDYRSILFLHFKFTCCKSLKVLGFVKRVSSEFKFSVSVKTIYCSFVRSIFVYSLVVNGFWVLWNLESAASFSCLFDLCFYIEHRQYNNTSIISNLSLNLLPDWRVTANN